MIKLLQQDNVDIAHQIHHVHQVSYTIEAALLKASNFPPLKRTVIDLQTSKTSFYGFWINEVLAASMELDISDSNIHICSLVVDPVFFRQGIGRKLVSFAKEMGQAKTITVETGLANNPAISLYKNAGFVETRQYLTDVGIWKIALSLSND